MNEAVAEDRAEIGRRLVYSTDRLKNLRDELEQGELPDLSSACVYAIGSFGRQEGCEQSDLDLFILGESEEEKCRVLRKFSRLAEIELKAELIRVTRRLKFPDFSGDGEYLVHHPVTSLIGNTGTPEDDSTNTLTARLLLLLESRPILNEQLYNDVIERVLEAYWRDYAAHSSQFIPAYLINDIQRIWRTFCVNYEARTSSVDSSAKAKRKLKNYKLRHSRLLTCFSGLAFLLSKYAARRTVTPADAREMTKLRPLERIDYVAREHPPSAAIAREVVARYEDFLVITSKSETELLAQASSKGGPFSKPTEAALGKAMFDLLWKIGGNTRFLQMIVV